MSKASTNPTYLELPPSNAGQWIDLLNRMRAARALLLRDAESFDRAAAVLEHIGQAYGKEIEIGLGRYKPALMDLVKRGSRDQLDEAQRLFQVVLNARNSAVHDGAWVRHLGERLAELFLILEAAILSKMTRVKHLMVAHPTTAELWQQIADVRRCLLLNSFSYLPILMPGSAGRWQLLADHELVRFLATAKGSRQDLMATTVENAVQSGLTLLPAKTIAEDDTIESLHTLPLSTPLLVVRTAGNQQHLVGILTAFDLL